jgi:Family of unknown function (DUF6236)
MRRGIVVSRPFRVTEDGGIMFGSRTIPDTELRFYMLYWDVIDIPVAKGIEITQITRDMEFLRSIGVIQQTLVQTRKASLISPDIPPLMQIEALRIREDKEPGCWSVANWGGEHAFPPSIERIDVLALDISLYRALPIPTSEVPFQEIIEFKEKRKTELQQLRHAITELELSILRSGDLPKSRNMAIEKLQSSIHDVQQTFAERWHQKLTTSLKFEVNVPTAIAGMLAGASVGSVFGLDTGLSAAIGAGAAALKLEVFSGTKKPALVSAEVEALSFVNYANQEFRCTFNSG